MGEIIEALIGCVKVLEDVDEALPDPKHYTVILALKACIKELDELDEQAGQTEPSK